MDSTAFTDEIEYDTQPLGASTSKTGLLKRKIDQVEDETPEDETQEDNPDTPMDTPLTTPIQSPSKKACVGVVGSDDEQQTPRSTPSQTPDGKKVRPKASKTPDKKGKGYVTYHLHLVHDADRLP